MRALLLILALLAQPYPYPAPPDKVACVNERGDVYYKHPLPSLTWPYIELPCEQAPPPPPPTPTPRPPEPVLTPRAILFPILNQAR